MSKRISSLAAYALLFSVLPVALMMPGAAQSQETTLSSSESRATLEGRLEKVQSALAGMQQQMADSEREIEALRTELHDVRSQLSNASATVNAAELEQSVSRLQEQSEVQQAEIKQHEQTKAESSSKYPVRISGMILFSSFLSDGAVDDVDQPVLALARTRGANNGSLSATMRQTILGADATGPHLWGARSGGDLAVDFFDTMPTTGYAGTLGIARLRTAHAYLAWKNTSLTALVDKPLISPQQPTSLIYQSVAPLGWSGNLWVWTPQLKLTQTRSFKRGATAVELGLMDPVTQPLSSTPAGHSGDGRIRQPAYEGRLSYELGEGRRKFVVGAGGYYSRQKFLYGQALDAWAGTLDWRAPLSSRVELSGALYRGRGLGALGGGTYKDYYYDAQSSRVRGLDAEGGWVQLKLQATRVLEANAAAGTDQGFARELGYSIPSDVYSELARNTTLLGNIIYRPRSYLLFSAEYRHLLSAGVTGASNHAQSLGLAAGYSF